MAAGIVTDSALRVIQQQSNSRCCRAFCLVRPPGHHCSATPEGFCVINNVVVAAKQASFEYRKLHGRAPRIAFLDVDVHQGNGTQALLESWNAEAANSSGEPLVLFMSIHRYDGGTFFPGTGAPTHCGPCGMMLNVGLDTARKRDVHRLICDLTMDIFARRLVLPLLAAYAPDLIFVSCGFDALEGDPLGGMGVVFGIERFVAAVCSAAPDIPVVAALEGGYDVESVAQGCCRVVAALADPESITTPPVPPSTWLDTADQDTLDARRTRHDEWASNAIATPVRAARSHLEGSTRFHDEGVAAVRDALRSIDQSFN